MSRFSLPWKEATLAVVSLVLFFGILEGLLALVGIEPVTREGDPFVGFSSQAPLFVPEPKLEGEDFLITAADKRKLFNEQRFRRKKGPRTFRIFCLGGSTTYGRPYFDSTSFAGWLRELLPVADSSRDWEVINAGGISYASYRVAALMEELAQYEPDLFIVYTGHNEFLEERTYGSLRELPGPLRSAAAVLARTRTWAAMSSLLRKGAASTSDGQDSKYLLPATVEAKLDKSAGLELYERDDALTSQILQHFRVSLERMTQIAKDTGAGLVFVTPASNLRSFSPFKSQHADGLSDQDRQRSEALLQRAESLSRENRWQDALAAIDQALSVNPRFADAYYARGQALLALERKDEAKRAFERARDEDVCPLRALSEVRMVLQEVAEETQTPLIDFIDLLEKRIDKEDGHSILGEEFFLDHVHPSIEGNRFLAISLLQAMTAQGTVNPGASWGKEAIQRITQRVEGEIDRATQGRALAQLAWTLDWAGREEDSRRLAYRALEYGIEEPTILLIAARHRAFEGDLAAAETLFLRAVRADPLSPTVHYQYGLFLTDLQRLEAAAGYFLRASVLWPQDFQAHLKFGLVMAERRRFDVALPSLVKAQRHNPGHRATEAAIARVEELLSPIKSHPAPLEIRIETFSSDAPRVIAQTKDGSEGPNTLSGVWTEWYETGELKSFAEYLDGSPASLAFNWDKEGAVRRQDRPAEQGSP